MTGATVAVRGAAAKALPARSIWWRLHHLCGLKLSLLLTLVLLTGTLATVAPEIDWLINPALRATPSAAPPARWGTLFDAARSAMPGGAVAEIRAPAGGFHAAEAEGEDAQGARRIVYLDPATAHVQGVGSRITARRVLRDLHRHLMLPGDIGLPIVGTLAIPLLVLLVTSFFVYKKWWRGFRRWPRPMKRMGDGRRYAGDLHRLAGLWSLWFLALIGLTGLWYLAEWAGAEPPPALADPPAATAEALDGAQLDALVTIARQAMPDLDIRAIEIDAREGVLIQGQATALLVRDRANAVLLDAPGATIRATTRGELMSAHQRIGEAADPLHFGTWGGLATRLIWFLFGALLTLLSATGALIYALRLQRERGWSVGTGLWRGMGWAAFPCAGLVGAALAGVVWIVA